MRGWLRREGLALLAAAALPLGAQEGGPLPEDPREGARLFQQKGCIQCHAVGGQGGSLGPDLSRIYLRGSLLDVAGEMWNHAPQMAEEAQELKAVRASFTSQEMTDLIAFLSAYQYYLRAVGRPGNPEAGQRLFGEKGCARCHVLGEANWDRPGPTLKGYRGHSPIRIAQTMWNHGLEMVKVMRQTGTPVVQFEGEEMLDVLAYVQTGGGEPQERSYLQPGSPNRGSRLFREKGCVGCHAVRGTGGHVGPDLGQRAGEFVQSVSHLAGVLWNHGPQMWATMQARGTPVPILSQEDMADLIAYLYFVNYFDKPGDRARGERLFAAKQCSRCHAVGGQGGTVGPDLAAIPGLDSPITLIAEMWNHAPRMEEEMRRQHLPWPRFQPGEMTDVLEYLSAERAAAASSR
ncbi:MAG: c-type cytochrome [Candidatus Latescibacterota bacterium]